MESITPDRGRLNHKTSKFESPQPIPSGLSFIKFTNSRKHKISNWKASIVNSVIFASINFKNLFL